MKEYMLVSKDGRLAYCIGTIVYCGRYALAHGVRAQTQIVAA